MPAAGLLPDGGLAAGRQHAAASRHGVCCAIGRCSWRGWLSGGWGQWLQLRQRRLGLPPVLLPGGASLAGGGHQVRLRLQGPILRASGGQLSAKTRFALSVAAFNRVAQYDAAISEWLSSVDFDASQGQGESGSAPFAQSAPVRAPFPAQANPVFIKLQDLRYGENPHQQAAFYTSRKPAGATLATAKQIQGKALSYNNLADADAALQTVLRFPEHPACIIVKHANPCGAALGDNILAAYDAAHRCDSTSAFGGIIAFNRGLDGETAREIISRQFVEVLIAPAYDDDALQVLSQKPNIRVLEIKSEGHTGGEWQLTSIHGGLLVQEWDSGIINRENLSTVSEREPAPEELHDLLFAWKIAKTVKSNAIVLAKNRATIGIGAGQTSRVFASQIAVLKAQSEGLDTRGSVLASDAFFPFRDGVDAAAKAGVRAIIQPGGSVRDPEVIAAANEHGMAMIFTGIRHFRH